MTRVFINDDPFWKLTEDNAFYDRYYWPCFWVTLEGEPKPPWVAVFRKKFAVDTTQIARFHVSADERYELYLDGQRLGRGPERSEPAHWAFESHEIELPAGEHVLAARVWTLGETYTNEGPGRYNGTSVVGSLAPDAQMSSRPGFILTPESETLQQIFGTGLTDWEGMELKGYSFASDSFGGQLAGARAIVDASRINPDWRTGRGEGWKPVQRLHVGVDGKRKNDRNTFHALVPAVLPEMTGPEFLCGRVRYAAPATEDDPAAEAVGEYLSDTSMADAWQGLLEGVGITIPAKSVQRVIIDLEEYYCAYHALNVSGGKGASIRLHWAEALFEKPDTYEKGDRDSIEGKYFKGKGETFLPDGSDNLLMDTIWWNAGRYLELTVRTGDEPLTIHRLILEETRYPLEIEYTFDCDDKRLTGIIPMMNRVMQMCMHETYMDCPYYEQLMYVGDTRLEILTTYVMSRDTRLPRRAIDLFNMSRDVTGITRSRFPSRIKQVIAPFSLWWIGMVHDYALWRDEPEFIRAMLPGIRGVIDHYLARVDHNSLVRAPEGWNYIDWVPGWENGMPKDTKNGISGPLNWLFVLALTYVEKLETWHGEPECAARCKRLAEAGAAALNTSFWNRERGLYSNDLEKTEYSEHAQCMALLSGLVPQDRIEQISKGLMEADDLGRTTIFFSHYLFETCRLLNRTDRFIERLALWFDLKERGFKTTIESPEPSRSDCHAWGAHPIYQYLTTILGVRPAEPGFKSVIVEPKLGPLTRASGTVPHPLGMIKIDLKRAGSMLTSTINLPAGLEGMLVWDDKTIPLVSGEERSV